MAQSTSGEGTGPLHEHTPAGEEAAQEDVDIPKPGKDTKGGRRTGEGQAGVNREDDPPA